MNGKITGRLRALILGVVAFSALACAAQLATAARDGDRAQQRQLHQARAATARYHSLEQARKDGYAPAGPCVASPAGVMGIHYENPELMADDSIDLRRPEILLYVPKPNGKLELVGLEYWKRDADQNLETSGDQPSLFGVPFAGPMGGHSPVMPIHYDLHVWLWAKNPNGLFAAWNPALSCGGEGAAHAH